MRYYIDPDFRPKLPVAGTAYCCQCQKPLNLAKQKYVRGNVNWEEPNDEGLIWEFKTDPNGADLLGPDCAKQIGLAEQFLRGGQ